ncbi:hypothetical protein AKJ58_01615 [candidate division MSBL1 archaeon SCGC-AAA385D11]|uniref:PD(D/E)XK endonuclease domain-containing protein n=1 Tax=candidate division MSBL1 archaeon SCGC-AAA385D11 TaxID=1698286 RepID=A0A133VN34_9EURY|nr:hypothetical protein AKJ58_01615 [candidate division MSBL1 archaeon SCGC-AAA385D11]
MSDKELTGLAGEFEVASELCRRGFYAQLTLKSRERTDVIVTRDEGFIRVQVKSKVGSCWPGCKGVYGKDSLLFFVDFEGKDLTERPDFYLLKPGEWRSLLEEALEDKVESGKVKIDEKNIPIWPDQEFKGYDVHPEEIKEHKERWDKVEESLR